MVALGATAIHALLGRALPIGRHRGQVLAAADGTRVLVTAHPSYTLRIPEPEGQARERALLAADLKTAMRELTA